ncbi:DUF6074 family protein [Agrobacterium sp. ES01]|uniref:DUF6074 family protein n=1 Tax=Agrobacterium sp. ES01 TaxID=3420714 RepID=UPI003D0BFBD9
MTRSAAAKSPAGALHFFPISQRSDVVRQAARELDSHNGQAALDFWKNKCRALGAELTARGCAEDEMRAQIMDFQAAVQAELLELHHQRMVEG